MDISFKKLKSGEEYERTFLADLWGYKGHQAISRGVVTPAGSEKIILFVTKEKQSSSTQYNDYIKDNSLFWEGEDKHGSDNRIINSRKEKDEIHLFYRDIHHTPFVYYGEIFLTKYKLFSSQPSQFSFSLQAVFN
jgi:hypothetical protein